MAKDFRFGVGLTAGRRRQSSVQDFARRAEDMGYDVVHVADHLYTTAPFPIMTAMAMATEKLRIGTFVLNAASTGLRCWPAMSVHCGICPADGSTSAWARDTTRTSSNRPNCRTRPRVSGSTGCAT